MSKSTSIKDFKLQIKKEAVCQGVNLDVPVEKLVYLLLCLPSLFCKNEAAKENMEITRINLFRSPNY